MTEATEPTQALVATRISGDECAEFGTDEALALLYGALAKARGAFKPVFKSKVGQVGHIPFKYAPLSVLQDATSEALAANGLAVSQPFSIAGGSACIRTILSHEAGARIVARFVFVPAAVLADLGKQSTYYRRYAYQSVLCVDSGDDPDNDGSQGMASGAAGSQKPAAQPQAQSRARGEERPRPTSEQISRPEKPPAPKHDWTEPPAPDGIPDPGPKTSSPGITPETSAKLNQLFITNRFKGPEVVALCKAVTGLSPGDLEAPGGEALALQFLAHAVKLVESRNAG